MNGYSELIHDLRLLPLRLFTFPIFTSRAFTLLGRAKKVTAQKPEPLRKRQVRLRHLLRSWPMWHDGHLELGLNELFLLLLQDERPNPRSLSTVRVSAEVVLLMMGKRSSRRKSNARRVLEARVLLAMASFVQQNYAAAHSEFSSILAYNNRGLLRPEMRYLALEYGGLTAYIAEHYDDAYDYLSSVPRSRLSSEAQSALERTTRERDHLPQIRR